VAARCWLMPCLIDELLCSMTALGGSRPLVDCEYNEASVGSHTRGFELVHAVIKASILNGHAKQKGHG
jgi:hypothetical protein